MGTELSLVDQSIVNAKNSFLKVATGSNETISKYYAKEANFLRSAFSKNSKFLNCTPESISDALTSIAQFDLSLNPSKKEAYLIPYGKELKLDISYIGLIKIAQNDGVLKHAEAILVYDNEIIDIIESDGITTVNHKRKPFNKGVLIGVYSKATLTSNVVSYEFLDLEELEKIRTSSKAPQSEAWKKWTTEMYKKGALKRHSKTWNSPKLSDAIEILNEHEGINLHNKKSNIIPMIQNNEPIDYTKHLVGAK